MVVVNLFKLDALILESRLAYCEPSSQWSEDEGLPQPSPRSSTRPKLAVHSVVSAVWCFHTLESLTIIITVRRVRVPEALASLQLLLSCSAVDLLT